MKASTKLLIVFFILVLLSLLGYNLLIKEQYLAGNFSDDTIRGEFSGIPGRKLPGYKHLVINGAIITATGEVRTFMPEVHLRYTPGKDSLHVVPPLNNLVKCRLKSDTLFVTIEKEKINDRVKAYNFDFNMFGQLVFDVSDVSSLAVKNGKYYLTAINTSSRKGLPVIDRMHITATNGLVNIGKNIIKQLDYSLGSNSKLVLSEARAILKLNKVEIDPALVEMRTESTVIITPLITKGKKGEIIRTYNESSF